MSNSCQLTRFLCPEHGFHSPYAAEGIDML